MRPVIESPALARYRFSRSCRSKSAHIALFAASLLILWIAGCQRDHNWTVVAVSGRISRDGRPLPGLRVVFWPDIVTGTKSTRASGLTDAQGRYTLSTDSGDSGAPVGRYRVCIQAESSPSRGNERLPKDTQGKVSKAFADELAASEPVRVPQKYTQFAKTPLCVEVKVGEVQVFDFDVPEPSLRKSHRH